MISYRGAPQVLFSRVFRSCIELRKRTMVLAVAAVLFVLQLSARFDEKRMTPCANLF